MAKALVKVEVFRERVRLRWTWQGKRRTLAIGPNNPISLKVAESVAKQIEADILSRNFDSTLKKYRVQEVPKSIPAIELYSRYLARKFGDRRVPDKHKAVAKHLTVGFKKRSAAGITARDAIEFMANLNCAVSTKSTYLSILREAWNTEESNPWHLVTLERDDDRPLPDPFSHEEVEAILQGFADSYYLNYVKGLLGIGCRPGELSALQWGDIDFERREVAITKSWSDRTRETKSTKTGKIRRTPMSGSFQQFLRSIQPEDCDPQALVFPGVKGGHLEAHNFLNRHWKPTLQRVGVRYRPTYNNRHTTWSNAIAQGMPIAEAAKYAGNRSETMMRHYLGAVTKSEMPDLF